MKNWKDVSGKCYWISNAIGCRIEEYESLDKLLLSKKYYINRVVDYLTHITGLVDEYRYIIKDCNGLIIPKWRIIEYGNQLNLLERADWRINWYKPYKHTRDYRKNPVPRTGKKSWNYYRKIKTFQERKESIYSKEYIRAKRNYTNLPNSWDDITRKDFKDRSWKRHRKTQWK